ncbi:MAG: methylornithine synthase PylB [Deltaproteobacteria bacterium]|nr:methylornithine synthase PylB [Deltaproteobacteria bacterium]
MKSLNTKDVEQIAARAVEGSRPTLNEAIALLSLTVGTPAADALFEAAQHLRTIHFGSRIFLYGFVYLSTYCRNNCSFCHWRRELFSLKRYRKTSQQMLEAANNLAGTGVCLIDLTMGEDPAFLSPDGFDLLCQTAAQIAQQTSLPIMLSPGVLDNQQILKIKNSGVTWYALYQETYNRTLFKAWRRDQDFDLRMESKNTAAALGLLVEDGLLVGAGASTTDLANSLAQSGAWGAPQVRAMAYVPSPGGLLPDQGVQAVLQELLTIATLRLFYPKAFIPASLDVEGLIGLAPRLKAGANVVTSLVPADLGLAGVACSELDIDNNNRGADRVAQILDTGHLSAGTPAQYLSALDQLRSTKNIGQLPKAAAETKDAAAIN